MLDAETAAGTTHTAECYKISFGSQGSKKFSFTGGLKTFNFIVLL